MWRDDWKALSDALSDSSVYGAAVGAMKWLTNLPNKRYGTFKTWFAMLAATALVSIFVGLGTYDLDLSVTTRACVIGVCAFVAEDILVGLLSMGKVFRKDPLGTAKYLWDAFRGKGGQ